MLAPEQHSRVRCWQFVEKMQEASISLSVTGKRSRSSSALMPGSLIVKKNKETKPNRTNSLQILRAHMVVLCVCVTDLPWLDGLTTFRAIFRPLRKREAVELY